MTRAGMANLITRLRGLANDPTQLRQDTTTATGGSVYWANYKPIAAGTVAVGGTIQGTAAYSLDLTAGRLSFVSAPSAGASITIEYTSSQFTNAEMQDVLDANVTHVEERDLDWLPDLIAGGTTVYHRAALGYRDWEEPESGTIYWRVTDSTGAIQGTSGYTLDATVGQVRFAANQAGSAYYVTGRSYDVYGAAADVWLRRQSILSDWYQFSADGASYARQQAFDHAVKMEAQMRSRAGQNRARGAVQVGSWVRTDIAGCADDD
jgi:hypothetical protein